MEGGDLFAWENSLIKLYIYLITFSIPAYLNNGTTFSLPLVGIYSFYVVKIPKSCVVFRQIFSLGSNGVVKILLQNPTYTISY